MWIASGQRFGTGGIAGASIYLAIDPWGANRTVHLGDRVRSPAPAPRTGEPNHLVGDPLMAVPA